MTNRNIFTVLFLAIGLFLQSCAKDNNAIKSILEVSPMELQIDGGGGQEYISILSNDDWLIRSEASWIRPITASGKASSTAVKASITFDINTDGVPRTAKLIVKTIGGLEKIILVRQSLYDEQEGVRGISSADDLLEFSKAVNSGASLSRFMSNGVIVLAADIDASSIEEWIPAGTRDNPFIGRFDGQGFSIQNIRWTADTDKYPDVGIIGYSEGADIRNLIVGNPQSIMTVCGDSPKVNVAAVVGYSAGGSISRCINNVNVVYNGNSSGADICIGGICGRYQEGSGSGVSMCVNNGDITSPCVCRAAGFVAYNEGTVTNCTNKGCIIANRCDDIGPAWGCSFNKSSRGFTLNKGEGLVGEYDSYVDNPNMLSSDAYLNAVASPAREGYELESVTIDWTKDSYYDWTVSESYSPCEGVNYYHCDFINVPRKMNVLEIDLTNPAVEITTAFADNCVPNPNGNKNSNNGYNIRETLSKLCQRKRDEGINIVAGINSGFFDSNDGISRGFHIEEGHPVYINNPSVVEKLPNHRWAFTVFEDGTASCAKKYFSGKIKMMDSEYDYYSINDTILRHASSYHINLYDYHYRKNPHPDNTRLINALADNVLYVIAEYVSGPMKVNSGYALAKVVKIIDGRAAGFSDDPYIHSVDHIGIALSGQTADEFKSVLEIGSEISLRCDIEVEGHGLKPIWTQNSTMFRIMMDGKDNVSSIPASNQSVTTYDPLTFPVVSEDGKKVWLVQVDGRLNEWVSLGVKAYEMYRIGLKLGGYNMTRFDGGGSSTMWVYNPLVSEGKVVNQVSDSKGERSCMNYILIKAK